MCVSQNYAVRTSSGTGETVYERYTVDTSYGAGVQAAAENAKQIINANRSKSDLEKMMAYSDAICDLTEYNYDADDDVPYGDPWQLVWVFDGDPETNVVCEGYAKAFKYLCDMGTSKATCAIAQGYTSGPHMWNIVTMEGHNYLVDLTMCDGGYDLFMKGYEEGSVANGYYIRHSKGRMRYTYQNEYGYSEEELTLYPMDYSEWKATVEKAPEFRISSDVIYPGYDAVLQLRNENPRLLPSEIQLHSIVRDEAGMIAEDNSTSLQVEAEYWTISEPGEYCFTVVRDGVESPLTEAFAVKMEELPEGPMVVLPKRSEIQSEAFAGDESITFVEAENCTIRKDAFTGSGTVMVRLKGDCLVETGAFEDEVVVGLDEMKGWMENYRFVLESACTE